MNKSRGAKERSKKIDARFLPLASSIENLESLNSLIPKSFNPLIIISVDFSKHHHYY